MQPQRRAAAEPIEQRGAGSPRTDRKSPFVTAFGGAARAWTQIRAAANREVPVRMWRKSALFGANNLVEDIRATAMLGDVLSYLEQRTHLFEDDDEDVSIWAPARQVVPELTTIIPPPAELPGDPFAQFWAGGRGQVTSLHCDDADNYNYQLYGQKRFVLFAPADAPHLYPCDGDDGHVSEFHVDAMAPDLERYPAFSQARPMGCTLAAGQCIFIPRGWPHQVAYDSQLAANLSYWDEATGR